jgi:hypothetical protein
VREGEWSEGVTEEKWGEGGEWSEGVSGRGSEGGKME